MRTKSRKISLFISGIMPKTNTSKMAAVFLILSAGIFGAYLVISNVVANGTEINLGGNANSLDQMQQNNGEGIFTENTGDSSSTDNPNQNNLTQVIANSLFNQVQASDITDKNAATAMSQGVLNDISNVAPQFKTVTDISSLDLKISGDNSAEAKKNYWIGVRDEMKKYFPSGDDNGSQAIYNVYGKLDSSLASKLSDDYKNLAQDFINMSVPSSLLDLHKELIAYFENANTVYSSAVSYSQDPIKGYFALEMIDKLNQEADQVKEKLNN